MRRSDYAVAGASCSGRTPACVCMRVCVCMYIYIYTHHLCKGLCFMYVHVLGFAATTFSTSANCLHRVCYGASFLVHAIDVRVGT